MSEVITPDVRLEPWSTGATVIVDVASVAFWVRDDVRSRARNAHRRSGAPGEAPGASLSTAARGLHRIVDLFAHHGVVTRRLILGTTLGPFPAPASGWRLLEPTGGGQGAEGLWRRATRDGRKIVERVTAALADRDISVVGLPGLFGETSEHCVDELCVLAAAHASWTGDGGDVIVVSRDADVGVAPLLAGQGRILLARRMGAQEAKALGERGLRHGDDPGAENGPPAHLRLLGLAMRELLQPEDLPDGLLRDMLALARSEPVPPVELVELEGRRLLRNASNAAQVLSSPLDVEPERTWFERRRPLLDRGVRATVVVDPFGLLAAANLSGIPGRIPTAASVAEALEPLSLPLPLGQLAVVPDLLDTDHGLIAVAEEVGGVDLIPRMRDVLTERVKQGLIDLDEEIEGSLDSYREDGLPETVGTASQFARTALKEIADSPAALEEKESAVLLAADLLWALVHTEGPVLLASERPDLVVLLDLMDDHFGPSLGMRGRVTRIGLHADPFTGEGIAVERSGRATRWPTALLTGRMIADLLRIGIGGDGSGTDGATGAGPDDDGPDEALHIADAVRYEPTTGDFAVLDLDGRRMAKVGLADIVQFPADEVSLLSRIDRAPEEVAELRRALARDLRLQLDLRRPLPRPRLARTTSEGSVGASVLSARVIGHRDDGVVVRVTSSTRPTVVLHARSPSLAALPEVGRDVEIVLDDDGEHCRLSIPDLADVPDHVGRPRPARMLEDDRAVLLVPLDPTDVRDDTGREVTVRRLLGPYPQPQPGDVMLVTGLDTGIVQAVSTSLPWVDVVKK
jgi:hypothetical protein